MNRNVLRMDHYCPWLINCVGHYNHKFFFLNLVYTSITALCEDGLMIHALAHSTCSHMTRCLLIQGVISTSLVGLVITPFCAWTYWLLSKNLTTIEYCEVRCDVGQDGLRSRYDQGVFANLRSVLGPNPAMWWCPFTAEPMGDGLVWDASQEAARGGADGSAGKAPHRERDCRHRTRLDGGGTVDRGPLGMLRGSGCAIAELGADLWDLWCFGRSAAQPATEAAPELAAAKHDVEERISAQQADGGRIARRRAQRRL